MIKVLLTTHQNNQLKRNKKAISINLNQKSPVTASNHGAFSAINYAYKQ